MCCDIGTMKYRYKIGICDGYRIEYDDNRKWHIILCDRVVMWCVIYWMSSAMVSCVKQSDIIMISLWYEYIQSTSLLPSSAIALSK